MCLSPKSINCRSAKHILCAVIFALVFILPVSAYAQKRTPASKVTPKKTAKVTSKKTTNVIPKKTTRVFYGQASFYANKFNGRKTASGEIFSQKKLTCACNVLPLGTWIKVTNLRNGQSVVVKVNDRIHPKMKRIVDLSKTAAQRLGYVSKGLTRVKVELIDKKQIPK